MGNRYAVSGVVGTALDEASGDAMTLMGKAITTGRALFLRSAWFYNTGPEDTVHLMDAASGASYVNTGSRLPVVCASGRTTMVEIPAPGLKFTTGLVAVHDGTFAAAGIDIGAAGGCGYEE